MSPPASGKPRPRAKVKSGCVTCKIRKVKCDEGKPSCQRCLTTGRVCDGYGIWGGGNKYENRVATKKHLDTPIEHRPLTRIVGANVKQRMCFEWFVFRTAPKLPAAFSSAFWQTLVFQASASETAVFHATVALSSAHSQLPPSGITPGVNMKSNPDEDECFMLQQYGRAIGNLQPHLISGTQSSVRVTLISCLLFVCLECLRGHYRSGIFHLESGLKLLSSSHLAAMGAGTAAKNSWEFSDYWIAETFSRLHMSAALFGQISTVFYPLVPSIDLPSHYFCSVNEARHCLDELIVRILHLTSEARQPENSSKSQIRLQGQINSDLCLWKKLHAASKPRLAEHWSPLESFANGLLETYSIMAEIMAGTCLESNNESIFDDYNDRFKFLLEQAIPRFKIALQEDEVKKISPMHVQGGNKSVCDMGSIPPIYYVAMKCRDHFIRLQALKLLRLLSHAETVWRAEIAVCVAEEVMRIEEADFYREFDMAKDVPPFILPVPTGSSIPPLPDINRIRRVLVSLPNGDNDNCVIECQLARSDTVGSGRLTREYDAKSKRWFTTSKRPVGPIAGYNLFILRTPIGDTRQ